MNFFQKLISSTTTYKTPRDSSLRSKPVKSEKKWKAPNYKGYKWGVGVGK